MNKTSSIRKKEPGLFGVFVWFLFEFIFWCLVGWFVAFFISISLFFTRGNKIVLDNLNYLLQGQLAYLSNISHTFLVQTPLNLVIKVAYYVNEWTFFKANLFNVINTTQIKHLDGLSQINTLLNASYPIFSDMGHLFIATTELISIRLVIFILFLPMFIFMGILGFIDGLTQRELRRYRGGRESALIYHRAKNWIKPSLLTGCVLYLTIPLNLSPDIVLLPFVLSFAYMVAITTKMFKKYV